MPPKLKKVFKPGESKTLSLRVTNRSSDRQPIHLEMRNVPDDWNVVVEDEDLVLPGRGDGIVRVSIEAPPPPTEKKKIGMRLVSVPQLDPDKETEIRILAKLKPPRHQRKGGLLSGGGEDGDEPEEATDGSEDQETTVIRASPSPDRPPEPDEFVVFDYAPVDPPEGLFPSSSFYYVSHIPLGNGSVLKLRQQVQTVLRPGDDAGRDFRRRMDVEGILEELVSTGYVELERSASWS